MVRTASEPWAAAAAAGAAAAAWVTAAAPAAAWVAAVVASQVAETAEAAEAAEAGAAVVAEAKRGESVSALRAVPTSALAPLQRSYAQARRGRFAGGGVPGVGGVLGGARGGP
jgi:hypothetical protein